MKRVAYFEKNFATGNWLQNVITCGDRKYFGVYEFLGLLKVFYENNIVLMEFLI